jgi:hypothetical protein
MEDPVLAMERIRNNRNSAAEEAESEEERKYRDLHKKSFQTSKIC